MDRSSHPADVPRPQAPLPPHLLETLRACEAIAARLSLLQQQVDAELRRLREVQNQAPAMPDPASPAILALAGRILRWLGEKLERP